MESGNIDERRDLTPEERRQMDRRWLELRIVAIVVGASVVLAVQWWVLFPLVDALFR
jgi:hypothetical protein